jgi:two-component system, LytTR family, sensor kinase
MRMSRNTFTRIVLHLAGWVLLFVLPPLILQFPIRLPDSFDGIMNWVIVVVFFYINYLWLIPAFLSKRRFLIYFASISLMLITCFSANGLYFRHVNKMEQAREAAEGHRENQEHNLKRYRFRGYHSTIFCLAILALGTSIRVTESWYENEKQKKIMENQKLGAELSLLKSQINPHFFFNTLNSIYSLAIMKSDRTPEAIIKLSEIMRYIIYETERKVVPLASEVEYIANYIELQRLRLPKEIRISFSTDIGKEESVIEPLLLLPFIENAFKHGIDIEKGGQISINITQTGKKLQLHVENPLVEENKEPDGQSGVGMNNTLKRLALLYHDNFTFTAGPEKDQYVVNLVLKLKEDEVSDS